QLLGPDDDERHGADQCDLVEAEIDHEMERSAPQGPGAADHDLVFASTSTVLASLLFCEVTCCGGAAGSPAPAAPSRMPSLKPLTAPPRSDPMFFSFFVPKISTTISSTTSQCQMLNEPMIFS